MGDLILGVILLSTWFLLFIEGFLCLFIEGMT